MEKQAKKILENYTGEKVIDIHPIVNRGQVNQIYLLKTPKENYIFRTDLSEDNISRFKKEKWCVEAANATGVLSPKIFSIGLIGSRPYMIMQYIEGENGDETSDDKRDKIWHELGNYARKINLIPVEGYGEKMIAPGIFEDSLSRYIYYNISSLTSEDRAIELGIITQGQSKKIKNIFQELLNTKFNVGLVHYDLSLKNTILASDGRIYLVDWGSAQSAPVPHLDIAEILDSSVDENSSQFASFLKGYGLSFQEYEKIKPEIAKVNLLVHLDKLRWAIDRRPDRIDYFSQKVKNKLAQIL